LGKKIDNFELWGLILVNSKIDPSTAIIQAAEIGDSSVWVEFSNEMIFKILEKRI